MVGTIRLAGLLIVALIAISGCGGNDVSPDSAPVATTTQGTLKGVESASDQRFLGIPYAAPPVGSLRWKDPQAAAPWSGARDAKNFATHCPQPASGFGKATNTSEDCLYLNVYRPKTGSGWPVMVYVHGGALYLGESDDYDPTELVKQGVVVVTINYRLGAFGFLVHPAFAQETGNNAANFGILDQQAALHWVRDNVAAFGGDRDNVTIFGESAGGVSVHTHLVSRGSAGLFNKAIVQSGSYLLDNPSRATWEAKGQSFATATGCASQTAACLRALTTQQILDNQFSTLAGVGGIIVVDNKVLTRTVRTALAAGDFNRVPVIEGSNGNEGSLITAFFFDLTAPPMGLGPVTTANYDSAQGVALSLYESGKTQAQVGPVYPASGYSTPTRGIDAVFTDSAFACPARSSGRAMSAFTTVYQYEFLDPAPPMIYLPDTPQHPAGTWGPYHASELQYLWGTSAAVSNPLALTPAQRSLADHMVAAWTSFAKTGVPNAGTGPAWPTYSPATDTALALDPAGLRLITDFAARHRCVFWFGS